MNDVEKNLSTLAADVRALEEAADDFSAKIDKGERDLELLASIVHGMLDRLVAVEHVVGLTMPPDAEE